MPVPVDVVKGGKDQDEDDVEHGCVVPGQVLGHDLVVPQRPRLFTGHRSKPSWARYFHVEVTRPEWLHVICLPTELYVFYPPDPARGPRWAAVTLALALHGFSALDVNVWFFGAAMLAHLALVTRIPPTA